jgi:hypothetical protein
MDEVCRVAEAEGAEAAFHHVAQRGAIEGGAAAGVQERGNENYGEAEARVDEQQLMRLDTEHGYGFATMSSPQCT